MLILSAPTIDFSTAHTNGVNDVTQIAFKSSEKLINIAEEALKFKNSLKKVVITTHSPRFDNQLGRNFVETANSLLVQMKDKSPLKDMIVVGHHSLEDFGVGKTHNRRYLNSNTGQYDGVHYYGPSGCIEYTKSLANLLVRATCSIASANKSSSRFVSPLPTVNRYSVLEGNF